MTQSCSTLLLYTLNQLDIYSKPLVDQFLNVNFFFICQLAHKVTHVWLKVHRKAEHSIGMIEFASFTFREIVFRFHLTPFLYCPASLLVALRAAKSCLNDNQKSQKAQIVRASRLTFDDLRFRWYDWEHG